MLTRSDCEAVLPNWIIDIYDAAIDTSQKLSQWSYATNKVIDNEENLVAVTESDADGLYIAEACPYNIMKLIEYLAEERFHQLET